MYCQAIRNTELRPNKFYISCNVRRDNHRVTILR